MSKTISIKTIIKGRVQGVFFRVQTQKTALDLNLAGYVKNLPDGSVEAVFQGDKSAVSKILEWCRTGPPGSRVDHVLPESTNFLSGCDSFDIRY
ncbi:MAG: acylphosphatase [Desulfobacteraceae bacterium]|nr:acylphosphatase [Desulfobacteraceae bacterium]